MTLSPEQIRKLRKQVHHLKPVILIGANGLTDAVILETERALEDHELIKIRIAGAEREERKQMALDICEATHAELVQTIGNMVAIYRKRED